MVKKTWWIAWLLATTLLLLSVSSVFAVTSTTGFTIWPAKTTTEVNKVWTIEFNMPLLSTSVNKNSIYVTDSKQNKISTTNKLSADGLSVKVTPSKAYVAGDYNLYITNELTSLSNAKHNELIIIPFTVQVPSIGMSSASLVVTVTKDTKEAVDDLAGSLTIEGPSGTRFGPSYKESDKGKYTFYIYESGDYNLELLTVNSGVINTQSIKLPTIKLPTIRPGSIPPTVTTKTVALTIATKEGVHARKSGSIGGKVIPEQYGVPVTVSNSTTTCSTKTDIDGNFVIYLPPGSYQLVVNPYETIYKKHSYKLTVVAGQMTSPPEIINVKESIGTLGLMLDAPVVDEGSGILSGIDSTTKQITGIVDTDAVVEIYDTTPESPKKIVTSKPKDGKFVAKLPRSLIGKRLQIKVIDSSDNVYVLEMTTSVS